MIYYIFVEKTRLAVRWFTKPLESPHHTIPHVHRTLHRLTHKAKSIFRFISCKIISQPGYNRHEEEQQKHSKLKSVMC